MRSQSSSRGLVSASLDCNKTIRRPTNAATSSSSSSSSFANQPSLLLSSSQCLYNKPYVFDDKLHLRASRGRSSIQLKETSSLFSTLRRSPKVQVNSSHTRNCYYRKKIAPFFCSSNCWFSPRLLPLLTQPSLILLLINHPPLTPPSHLWSPLGPRQPLLPPPLLPPPPPPSRSLAAPQRLGTRPARCSRS